MFAYAGKWDVIYEGCTYIKLSINHVNDVLKVITYHVS